MNTAKRGITGLPAWFATGLLAAILFAAAARDAWAAPKAELWPYWEAHAPTSQATIDHSVWDDFLKRYITPSADGINRVAYGAVTQADRKLLDSYIDMLATTNIRSLNRQQQFPYWINLYNALTVQLVLTRFPVGSIKDIDISPGFFAFGPWDAKLVTVEGEQLSLNDIEHRILRPIWRDPRIHYAVNCASLGCPDLAANAYTAVNIDAMLDRAARDYINHPRGVEINGGKLRVSKIYDWYAKDFGNSDTAIIAHLREYARPDLAGELSELTRITGTVYDWALNDAQTDANLSEKR